MISVTDNQYKKCQEYLKGGMNNNKMYTLFKTYLNDYIKKFGYKSWQCDPIDLILNNFCNAVKL